MSCLLISFICPKQIGEFFSHFNPEYEPVAPPPDFNVDIMSALAARFRAICFLKHHLLSSRYAHFWRLLALLGPVFGAFTSLFAVIGKCWLQPCLNRAVCCFPGWGQPYMSLVVLLMYILIALNPW